MKPDDIFYEISVLLMRSDLPLESQKAIMDIVREELEKHKSDAIVKQPEENP